MSNTPNLALPEMAANQNQKHVTYNSAMRNLDATSHIMVKDRNLTAPPGGESDGDRYLVAATATGSWVGQEGNLAAYQDGTYEFYSPVEGWIAWVEDEEIHVYYNGTGWTELRVSPAATFQGFRAYAGATQALSAATEATVTLGTEDYDTETSFASNVFTVPAALDGKYMMFLGGIEVGASDELKLHIRKASTNVATSREDASLNTQVHYGPVLVSTGDTFSLRAEATAGATIQNNQKTFLSGFVVEIAANDVDLVTDSTTSRTLSNADLSGRRVIEFTNASAIALDIDTGLTALGPVTCIQAGAGAITFTGGTATVNAKSSATKSNGQYSSFTIIPKGSDTYYVIGDITT